MEALAVKTKKGTIIVIEMILGIIVMGAIFVGFPIYVFSIDAELIKNLFIWLLVLGVMLFFGSIGVLSFLRPYLRFRNLPEVQAETDGTYLYIHSKKEAKIPLSDMKDAEVDAETPLILSKEFMVHLISEEYGTVIIKVPNYGKYKLYFIANAKETVYKIYALTGKMVYPEIPKV